MNVEGGGRYGIRVIGNLLNDTTDYHCDSCQPRQCPSFPIKNQLKSLPGANVGATAFSLQQFMTEWVLDELVFHNVVEIRIDASLQNQNCVVSVGYFRKVCGSGMT